MFGKLGARGFGSLGGLGTSSGVTPDAAATTAFLARANAVTTLDATHTAAYKALINGGVADGWWTKLDLFMIFAAQSAGVALLNIPSATYTASNVNGASFVVDRGFTGNGLATTSAAYIQTTFDPSTASSPSYAQNSAHGSAWNLTNSTDDMAMLGWGDTVTQLLNVYPKFSDGNSYLRVQDAPPSAGFANSDPRGFLVGNRSTSTARQAYFNGAVLGVYGATPSNALYTPSVPVSALWNPDIAGATGMASLQQCAAISAGGSLNATDQLNFYNRMRTYMTAVGVA